MPKSDSQKAVHEDLNAIFSNMDLFRGHSEDPKLKFTELEKNVKKVKDASVAIREFYQATNKLLGSGTFGKVFLFKSKNLMPEKQYAVKVMLKVQRK